MLRPPTLLVLCACLAVLATLAVSAPAPLAVGAGLGFLLGAFLSLGGALWVGRTMQTRPARVLAVQAVVFGAKLAALLVGVLCLRGIAPALGQADWRAALVAYAAAVALLAPLASFDALARSKALVLETQPLR